MSKGGGVPWRLKIRAPSFCNLSILPKLCVGTMVSDVVAILGLSRATYRKMVQNLLWATGSNAVASTLLLPPTTTTQVGYQGTTHIDVKGFTIAPSAYATVTFTFAKAGQITIPVMAVQPVGIYAGLGPITS